MSRRLFAASLLVICFHPSDAQTSSQDRRVSPVPTSVVAQRKLALVIGNTEYSRGRLVNPVNDAADMSEALRHLGFTVTVERDLNLPSFQSAIDAFVASVRKPDLAFVYYSGHGLQIQNENFLLPVEFSLPPQEAEVQYFAYSASKLRDKLEASGASLRVIVLDACRDNPWRPATRNFGGGLAPMATAAGTLIAYGTGDNRTADDNPGERNGLFTKYLISALDQPGLGLSELFRRVRRDVFLASKERQNPALYDNVVGDLVLNDPEQQRRRVHAEIARLEAENQRLVEQQRQTESENARRRAEAEKRNNEAKLTAARLLRQTLEEEMELRRHLDEAAKKRETERIADEIRLRELRVTLEKRRASGVGAQTELTMEEARRQADGLRAKLAEFDKQYEARRTEAEKELLRSYAPLLESAQRALERDQFETTAEFEARRKKAQADADALQSRIVREQETLRYRTTAAKQAEAMQLEEQLSLLEKGTYLLKIGVNDLLYDADRQRFRLGDSGRQEFHVPAAKGRALYAAKDSLRVLAKLDGNLVALIDPLSGEHFELSLSLPAKGDVRVNPKDGLRYIWIPPGSFQMGCSPRDKECYDDEKPTHQVTITKGFWMAQTEVTQAAYERVLGSNPSFFKGADRPVEQVTWVNATDYCTTIGMRLPTEAEWEYAARGGSSAARYGKLSGIASYGGNSAGQTHPVGQKAPNGFGLQDMLGNVWEWANDRYDRGYYGRGYSKDPSGPRGGQYQVLRGGSWFSDPGAVRASFRFRGVPGDRNYSTGFRCVGE